MTGQNVQGRRVGEGGGGLPGGMTWISYSWCLAIQVYSVDLLRSIVLLTEILGSIVHPNEIKGSMGHPVSYTFHDPSYLQSAALLGLWYYK